MMTFLNIALYLGSVFSIFQIFNIGNFGFTYYHFFAVVLILFVLKRVCWNGDQFEIPRNKVTTTMTLFFMVVLLSGITPLMSGNKEYLVQFVKTTSHLFFYTSFALIFYSIKIDEEVWYKYLKFFFILAILVNLFGVYQLFARIYDLPLAWLEVTNKSFQFRLKNAEDSINQLALSFANFYRMTAVFSEPSSVAGFNIAAHVMFLAPYLSGRPHYFKSLFLKVLFVISNITGLFLAFSLTGFVGFFLTWGSIFIFERNNLKIKVRTIIMSFLIIVALIYLADFIISEYTNISIVKLFEQRITTTFGGKKQSAEVMVGESFFDRKDNAKKAYLTFLDKPVLGTGLGLLYTNKVTELYFLEYGYLNAFVETGIIGGTLYIVFTFWIFFYLYKIKREYRAEKDSNLATIVNFAFYYNIYIIFTSFFTANSLISSPYWLHYGLALWIIADYHRRKQLPFMKINFVKIPLKNYFINSETKI